MNYVDIFMYNQYEKIQINDQMDETVENITS